MALKNCSACTKLVYPVEVLKCLDKTWHKACFKCQVCGMTLNMKNYKGYNKLPYCNAHYPTTKFTAVADTPENLRIKKNTQAQSNIQYHAQFEAAKGKHTSVADDPETLRVRKNMNTISNVAYHGEMSRKQEMENARPSEVEGEEPGFVEETAAPDVVPVPRATRAPGSISDYNPAASNSPYSSKTQSTTVYNSSANSQRQAYSRTRRIGSITDYDPVNEQYGSIVGQYTEPKVVQAPPTEAPVAAQPAPVFAPPPPREPSPPPPREPSPPPPAEHEPPAAPEPEAPAAPAPAPEADSGSAVTYLAVYDYTAGDDDEVGFQEGDRIINSEIIDEGWMTGTVERTGETGMLPSNYVEAEN